LPSSLLEQVKKNASDYEIVQEILTEYELIVDSSEQPGKDQESINNSKILLARRKLIHLKIKSLFYLTVKILLM